MPLQLKPLCVVPARLLQSLTMDNEPIRAKVVHIRLPGESSLSADGSKSESPGNGLTLLELIRAPLRDDPHRNSRPSWVRSTL